MLHNFLKGKETGRHTFGAWHTVCWLDRLWVGFHTRVREKSQCVVMTGPSRGLCRHYSAFCTVIVRNLITHLTSYSFVTDPRGTTSLLQKRSVQLLSSSDNLVVLMTSPSRKSLTQVYSTTTRSLVATSPTFFSFKLSIIHVCSEIHNFSFCIDRKRKTGGGWWRKTWGHGGPVTFHVH